MNKKKFRNYIIVVGLLLISFVTILAVCDNSIRQVNNAKESAIIDVKKRDFQAVWAYIESLSDVAERQATTVANRIEAEIKQEFPNLDELEEGLNNGDEEYVNKVSEIIRDNIDGVHLGNVPNNRNAMIVLERYDMVVEDLLVDPESREEGKELKDPSSKSLLKYRDTTYNVELFDNAIRRIRNHTDQVIAIEPYNYIDEGTEHELISDMNFGNLERVYINEGFEGLRNYQFLVPVYITDTGDIFGQKDIVNGVRQDNHKFIVIQTFNLLDQLVELNPEIGDDDYLRHVTDRYDSILTSLYLIGLAACIIIINVILYFFSLYNTIISKNEEISKLSNANTDNNKKR